MEEGWRTKVLLPDGTVVECVDVLFVDRDGDHWTLDVVVMLDGGLKTIRVEADYEDV